MSALGLQTMPAPAVSPGPAANPGMAQVEQHPEWPMLARMPLKLAVAVPIRGFKIRNLVALMPGQIIQSTWPTTEDIPLHVSDVQLGWCEFEVVEQRMAMRLTRLA